MAGPIVDILLATYNGEQFLPRQLQSLKEQDFEDWRLIVRDDGSTDDTLQVLRRFSDEIAQPVVVTSDKEKGLGASRNFGRILDQSTAPYFAFCDQDDVWLPSKISKSLAAVRGGERSRGGGVPVLAHCDLEIVGQDLEAIAPSFRSYASLQTPLPGDEARHLMLQNFVTGCAMMGNAALRKLARPIPDDAMMHDWWLALVAAGIGQVVEIPDVLIRYRQHGHNTLGAKRGDITTVVRRFAANPSAALARGRRIVLLTRKQAEEFARRFESQASDDIVTLYRAYAATEHQPLLARKAFILKNRLFSQDLLRIAALTLVI